MAFLSEAHTYYAHTIHALLFVSGVCVGMWWGLILMRTKR